MPAAPWPRRAWPYGVLLALSLVSLLYGGAGYAMTASLQPPYARRVAVAYLALVALAALGLVIAAAALYRVATRPADDAGAAV